MGGQRASLFKFGTTRSFTMMGGTTMETEIEDRHHECLLMCSGKLQKLMRKTSRNMGRNAEFYVIDIANNGAGNRISQWRGANCRSTEQLRSLFYDNFPELLQQVDSPHVSREWNHRIDTTRPMKHQRLNKLSHAERAELNRQLKDAVEVGLTHPSHSEFGSSILFCA
jgi:hypothetical protein